MEAPRLAVSADNPAPLYHQVKEEVLRQIASGALKPGDQLPTERELEARYAVSRITVRQALKDLMSQGLLLRQRGRGTFVAQPRINQGLQTAVSFSRDMIARGLQPGARTLTCSEVPAPAAVAEHLGVQMGAPVYFLERLRFADGVPMALQQFYLPAGLFPGLLAADLNDGSLYELLHATYGIIVQTVRRTIEGLSATRAQARLLQVREGAPLLRLGGTNLDQYRRPVECGWTLYRADKYTFYLEY